MAAAVADGAVHSCQSIEGLGESRAVGTLQRCEACEGITEDADNAAANVRTVSAVANSIALGGGVCEEAGAALSFAVGARRIVPSACR